MKLRLSAPYAVFYVLVFVTMGIYLPFWPLWLKDRGLSQEQAGYLMSMAPFLMILISPTIAYFADRSGRKRVTLGLAALFSAGCFFAMYFAGQYQTYLLLQAGAACAFLSLIPLGDSQALRAVRLYDLNYGRLRLWGSLAFIGASFGIGWFLDLVDRDWTLWLLLLALGSVVLISTALPKLPDENDANNKRPFTDLLKAPVFLLFILGTGMIVASHAAYYALGSLYMKSLGYSETLIGFIWAIGVIAEVVLFAFSKSFFLSTRSRYLIMIGGVAGLLRWGGLSIAEDVVAITLLQILHALTFGATHLGAMSFISRHAPEGLSSSAQSLYSGASNGLMMGLAMMLSAWLYGQSPSWAFAAMAVLATAGTGVVVLLSRAMAPAPLAKS